MGLDYTPRMSDERAEKPLVDQDVHSADVNSVTVEHLKEPEAEAVTSIPFKKSLELFFTTKAPPKRQKQKFFFWNPPGQSKFEKWLVFKLDLAILPYICLSYFIRYLDATNVSSAYITGMKEDLKISGKQYVWLQQLFSAAYCFSGFFFTVLLTRFRFSRLIPLIEIGWGLLTLFVYKAQSWKTVAILRFFLGLLEGAVWPSVHYLLGSWYTKQELGKRTSIWTGCGIAGVLLSGLIQSGLQKSMDGRHGLAGWRWLFIIDAILTFPVAFLGWLVAPDSPDNTVSRFYLTQEELEFARERVKVNGRKSVNRLDLTSFKRVFSSYQWYLFVIAWILWGFGGTLQGYFGVVLKALHYNVYDRNNIPSATSGIGIFACFVTGFFVDILGRRIETALLLQVLWISGAAIVKRYDVTRGALIYGYSILGVYYATSPIIVGWCNELTKEDSQLRAATLGSLNLFSGLLGIPYSIELFDTDYAPRYEKATTATLVLTVLLFFYFFVIVAFDRYQERKRDYIKNNIYEKKSEVEVISI